jgi:hypothetical protein
MTTEHLALCLVMLALPPESKPAAIAPSGSMLFPGRKSAHRNTLQSPENHSCLPAPSSSGHALPAAPQSLPSLLTGSRGGPQPMGAVSTLGCMRMDDVARQQTQPMRQCQLALLSGPRRELEP